jgi:diguanylate cyclase (GGDEF)-like protein
VRPGARARRASHRLAGRLGRVQGETPVCEAIIAELARAVDARIAAIAVPDDMRRLSIKATHGYPLLLVEHLRFEPGVGVLGRVYQNGTTLCVAEASGLPAGTRKRPRYRTESFVAVPIRSAHEVLAVACVADRADDLPFTREDVAVLQALCAPAALALERERAVLRAEVYAHAAAIDPVSGLFNRRYFEVRLEEELQRSRRHAMPLSLAMLDLDDFKLINDSFGHLVGDAMIRETAEILRRAVRMFDVCTRFGGEEFAIIMPGSGADSAAVVAERIRDRIAAFRSPEQKLGALSLSASVGIAALGDQMTARGLIERADQALYQAKRAGKNRVHVLTARDSHDRE